MDLSALFERVAVINLDSRPDRWEQFLKRLPVGWPFRPPERVTAIDATRAPPPEWWTWHRGGWGCYRTHLRLIETCLNSNIESILVFEDDAVFSDNFSSQVGRFFEQLPADWSFVYLGGEHLELDCGLPRKVNDWVYRPFNVNRTHAFGFRGKEIMQRVYRHLNATRTWRDHAHIDHHLGELHKQMDSGLYVPHQWIVGQEEGASDVTDNYVPVRYFRGAEELLQAQPQLPMVAVLGSFGAGTTCVAAMLHHAGVSMDHDLTADPHGPQGTYEAPWLARICRNSYEEPALIERNTYDDRVRLLRLWAADHTGAVRGRVRLAGGKHPTLSLMGPELLEAWNAPHFVVVRRDIEDSIRAVVQMGWGWSRDALQTIIPRMVNAIDTFLQYHAPRHVEVQYEDLLRDPGRCLDDICELIGHLPDAAQRCAALAVAARDATHASVFETSEAEVARLLRSDNPGTALDKLVADVATYNPYEMKDDEYNRWVVKETTRSAEAVVPDLIAAYQLRSVVDVGCNIGIWLHCFQQHGVQRITGVDGTWINRTWLKIPAESFVVHDLRLPYTVGERFDMAVCLEVAEHLDAAYADHLVELLTALSDRVLFSAATPGQGGQNHVNEQPHEYWIKKFTARGFVGSFLGSQYTQRVVWWYSNNLYLFEKLPPGRGA